MLYGARADEQEIKPIAIPDRLWGDANPNDPTDLLQKQPIGGRLFVDGILDDKPVSPSFYDGLRAQEVIDAGIESHETGRWVEIK
jgi:predicted dehydrogenase